MKKTLALFLALALLFAAAISSNAPVYAEDLGGGAEIPIETPPIYPGIDPNPEATPAPTETQAPSYDPVVPTEPVVVTPAEPAPTEAPAPAVPGTPVVTKHPTGETVKEGGYAEFVARADYCQEIEWYFSYGENGTEYLIWFAPDRFPGLVATGIAGERLGLDHIPSTMDGWQVRAKFIGTEGSVYSDYAEIHIKFPELTVPTIAQQPRSVSLRENEAVNLEVTATAQDANSRLTYQWYMNSIDSNTGGRIIYSATNASYIPDYIVGTTYYYCVVRSTDGNSTSQPARTACAAVTYSAVPETTVPPTTQPVTIETSAPETVAPLKPIWAETTEDAAPDLPTVTAAKAGNSLIWILVIAILVIVLLSLLAIFLILKLYPRDEEEDEEEEEEEVDFIPPVPKKKAKEKTTVSRFAQDAAPVTKDPEWDDLSDLPDLSIYFDDDNK